MVSDLALDSIEDERIRLNFNITMLDLKCEWAVIDVVSSLGTDQNVTAHVTKWDLDSNGVRKQFKGRNRNQHDIELFDQTVTDSIEELHEDGEDAVSFDAQTLQFAKNEFEYLFVDFYASWCNHCRGEFSELRVFFFV
jgi:thiol-disulfide isomerase/thioredoxin